MITVVFIGGIRTHYIKINAIQYAINRLDASIRENFNFIFIDTGQHFDVALNGFKKELNLQFDYTLTHDNKESYEIACDIMNQLGAVFDDIQRKTKIDYVAVMGDVTTTIISTLSSVLKGIKVIHIESGARVKKGVGVEEYYRIATDHMASLCFASTETDYNNLVKEGLKSQSYFVGDVLYDYMKDISYENSNSFFYYKNRSIKRYDCSSHDYVLSSLHHSDNFTPDYLSQFFEILHDANINCLFIAHPKVLKILHEKKINLYDATVADYIPYKENLKAIANSKFIITDSGGIQREAYYLNKRCIVRSDMNIWKDLITCGSNAVASQEKNSLIQAINWARTNSETKFSYSGCFGEGDAIKKMLNILLMLEKK